MDALELIVDEGRPANASRFFQLGHDLMVMLDELSDIPVQWRITDLRTGSAHARVSPPMDEPEAGEVLRDAVIGLIAADRGAHFSDDWSPDAIKSASRFVEHGQRVDETEDWVPPRLVLVTGNFKPQSVELTTGLRDKLVDLQPFERSMPGSIRGELVGLNVSRGNRASLRLPNRRVVRIGFDISLRDQLKDALYKQVELSGLARQDGDGRIFHLRADNLRVLTKPKQRWIDVFGMDPDFTEGALVDDWLEANRGEA